ncbi:MAG TPA: hypothetical protein V6C81_21490 [Planktothrix sp.]|jgi:hypothetical protein
MKTLQIAFLMLFGLFVAAHAQAQQTWLPTYDRSAAVQVSPGMVGQPGINFSDNFASQISQHASGYEVHVVVTQQGSDLSSSQRIQWSAEMLHNFLWDAWVNQGMNERRAIVCLYIRANDSLSGSIGCRVGSALHDSGVSPALLGSTSGPVNKVGSSGLFRSDAQSAFIKVVDNIVSASASHFWFWFWVVVIIIILLIVFSRGGGGVFVGGSCSSCSGGGCSSCGGGGGA